MSFASSRNSFPIINLVGADPACRDAIEGFTRIAATLDRDGAGVMTRPAVRLQDIVALAAGWVALAAMVFFPALQLAGLALCVVYLAAKTMRPSSIATATPTVAMPSVKVLSATA